MAQVPDSGQEKSIQNDSDAVLPTNVDDTEEKLPPIPERKGLLKFYALPVVQIAMTGFTCFMCPGMFNALSGMGGGGQVDATTANKANTALYAAFAGTGFLSGSINNNLGPRLTMLIGSFGYALYIASFLSYNINGNQGFVVAAGSLLGICAGLLWTAQGSLMLAYATEKKKGTYTAVFWSIFNMGAVLGSAIQLGLTYNSEENTVKNDSYIAFLVLALIGSTIPMLLVDPRLMRKSDGTRVRMHAHPSWKTEIMGLFKTIIKDPYIVFLFPGFIASNWFYTYQFNDYNGALFTLRTRALNSMLYWLFQIAGSWSIGTLLDSKFGGRRTRAFIGWILVFAMMFAVFGGNYHYQKDYTRESVDSGETVRMDFKDSGYAGHIVLYIWCGIMDSALQCFIYWIMGAVSNDASKLAFLVGYYKGIQSAGSSITFALDLNKTSFMKMLAIAWGIGGAGMVIALPMLYFRIKDHTDEEDEIIDKRLASSDK